MAYHPDVHQRRSIRLKGYDYSKGGAYFVTICTYERECLFGEVVDGEMQVNDMGKVVLRCWNDIPAHFPHVALDEYVVMPNHVHGILFMRDCPTVGAKNFSPLPHGTTKTIGSVLRGFKIGVTKELRQHCDIYSVWQRNYYERVIRDDRELAATREYIANNPAQWATDDNNPRNSP